MTDTDKTTDTDKVVLEFVKIHAKVLAACGYALREDWPLEAYEKNALVSVLRNVAAIYSNTTACKLLDPFAEYALDEGRPANFYWLMAAAVASTQSA